MNMARPVISPMNIHATAPETFSVLQQRIRVAEEQAVSLIQDLGNLGVTSQSLQPIASEVHHPISPYQIRSAFMAENDMLWKNCEALVSRVCHMESIIQTLKLSIFRLHTEKELNPKNSAQLEERLNMLQEEHAQELKVVQLEMMRLRQKLHEEIEEKEMAQDEKERLSAALEITTATKSDVAIAAEELRTTKNQITLRLQEVEEQLLYERSFRVSLEESQAAVLHSVEGMEKVVELKCKQVQLLQKDCQSLQEEGQTFRDRLHIEEEKNRQLEEECKRLKGDLDARDDIVSQLREEGKAEQEQMTQKLREQDLLLDVARANITAELQNAHSERLQLEKELKSLHTQHSECKRRAYLAEEKLATQKELQESAIAELGRNLEAARQEGETLLREKELLVKQVNKALSDTMEEKNKLEANLTENKLELATLKSALQTQEKESKHLLDHLAALEHRQQAQQQVEQVLSELTDSKNKLAYEKGRLQSKVQQLEADLKSLADMHTEGTQLRKLNTALETKYNQINTELSSCKIHMQHLEAQLKQTQSALVLKEEDFALAVRSRDESLRECERMKGLMKTAEERGRQKISVLQRQLVDVKGDNNNVSVMLENVLASHSALQKTVEKLQTELGCKDSEITGLRKDRFQSQQRTQHMEAELVQCQDKLHLVEAQQYSQVESLQRALDVSQEDNKKLALSLEQTLKNNSSLQNKLSKVQDQLDSKKMLQQQLEACREQVAEEGKMEAKLFSEHLESLKKQFQLERAAVWKATKKDLTELKNAVNEATSKSEELSRVNRELRQKVTELGKTVSNQQVKLKKQKKQIQQQLNAKANSGQNTEQMKSQKIQKFMMEMMGLQSEVQKLTESEQIAVLRSQEQESQLQTEKRQRQELESTCQTLEEKVRQLKKLKEAMENKLKAVGKESEQISANLEEAHCWFKAMFDSLQQELVRKQKWIKSEKCCEESGVEEDSKGCMALTRKGMRDAVIGRLVKLPSHSLLNLWETKQELKLISRTYLADLDRR